ncbi:MAG TPA: alpha/beta hydrolase [Methylomirabilota bacterium]|nr:alpha/beta hydrolase [Methylomirabilota bacterium]
MKEKPMPALAAAGYPALAPDQRGYSPGVRPDPAKSLDAYGIDRLVQARGTTSCSSTRPPAPGSWRTGRAWYRAAGTLTAVEVGPVGVPTLYVWGDTDATVGPSAARFTAEFVTGLLRLEVLPGVGHFVTDQAPEAVTRGLLSHLARHR